MFDVAENVHTEKEKRNTNNNHQTVIRSPIVCGDEVSL